MKEFLNMYQGIFNSIAEWPGYFLGVYDGLFVALVAFVVIDFITSVLCTVAGKKISNKATINNICRKVMVFLLVGMANILDVQIIGNGNILRTSVILFYLSNEGISILENAKRLGLPIPEKLNQILAQLCRKMEQTDDEQETKDDR